MRLRFKTNFRENLAFQQSYHREWEKQASPAWFRTLSGLVLFVGIITIGYAFFPVADRLIAFYFGALAFAWLWHLGHSYVYRCFASRYLRESDDSELCFVEIADGRYESENRGIRTSFPLSALSALYERDGFVYLHFGRLGAGRLPFSAFESAEQRAAFITLANSEAQKPNKSPEPTPTAVTSPAAQEPRQP